MRKEKIALLAYTQNNISRYNHLQQKYGENFGLKLFQLEYNEGTRIKEVSDVQIQNCINQLSSLPFVQLALNDDALIYNAKRSLVCCIKIAVLTLYKRENAKEFKQILSYIRPPDAKPQPPPFIDNEPPDFKLMLKTINQTAESWKFHFTEKFEQFNNEPIELFEAFMSYIPKGSYDPSLITDYFVSFLMSQMFFFWQQKTYWNYTVKALKINENDMTPEKCTVIFLEFESLLINIRNRMLQNYLIIPLVKQKSMNDDFLRSLGKVMFAHVFDLNEMNEGLIQWNSLLNELTEHHKSHYKFLLILTDYFKELLSFFHSHIVKLVPTRSMQKFISEGKHNFFYRTPDYIVFLCESVLSKNTDIFYKFQGPFISSLVLLSSDLLQVDSWEGIVIICEKFPWLYDSFKYVTQSLYNFATIKLESDSLNLNLEKSKWFTLGCRDPTHKDYAQCNFSIPKRVTKCFEQPIIIELKSENPLIPLSPIETASKNPTEAGTHVKIDYIPVKETNVAQPIKMDEVKEEINDEISVEDEESLQIKLSTQDAISAAKNYQKIVPKVLNRKEIRENLLMRNEKADICTILPNAKQLYYVSESEGDTTVLSIDQFASLCKIFFPSKIGLDWSNFLEIMKGLKATLDNHYGSAHVFKFANNARLRVDRPHKPGKETQSLSTWKLRFVRKFLTNVLLIHPFYFADTNYP